MTDFEEQQHWAEQREHAVQAIATEAKARTLRAEIWAKTYAAEYAVLRSNVMSNSEGQLVFTSVDARAEAKTLAAQAAEDFDSYCRRECP